MEIRLIILAFWVLILSAVIIGIIVGIRTLEERLDKLERQDLRNKNNICDLISKVGLLNDIAEYRNQLELAAERKEKMADYLVVHASDSVTNRANALYDIATGKVIKEEKQ